MQTNPKKSKHDILYNNGLTKEENSVFHVKTANFTTCSEMKAHDSLPKVLRDAVNNSSIIKWSSVTVVELLNEIIVYHPLWSYDQCVEFAAQCINQKNNDIFHKACEAKQLFIKPVTGRIVKRKEL